MAQHHHFVNAGMVIRVSYDLHVCRSVHRRDEKIGSNFSLKMSKSDISGALFVLVTVLGKL